MKIVLGLMILCASLTWAKNLSDDISDEPLLMENADKLEGYRSRGEIILVGHVRFRHGHLTLETERAVWVKEQNLIYCQQGIKVSQNASILTADRGSYSKSLNEATAQGRVHGIDSSGEAELFGDNLIYNRATHVAVLTGQPLLKRYSTSTDTVSHKSKKDTLEIRGEKLEYNDSTSIAIAENKVEIRREKMRIYCDKAEFHDQTDSLFLKGDPRVTVDDNEIKGQLMRMSLQGDLLQGLLVKGKAIANSLEAATDTSAARQSNVEGDSLLLAFKNKAIDSVQVFNHAKSRFYEVDQPKLVNTMNGDYMVMRFRDKKIHSAIVSGGAKSTYFQVEKKKLKGKNMAEGDTISFAFVKGKVDEVQVQGRATGTYYAEVEHKLMPKDSTSKGPVHAN